MGKELEATRQEARPVGLKGEKKKQKELSGELLKGGGKERDSGGSKWSYKTEIEREARNYNQLTRGSEKARLKHNRSVPPEKISVWRSDKKRNGWGL